MRREFCARCAVTLVSRRALTKPSVSYALPALTVTRLPGLTTSASEECGLLRSIMAGDGVVKTLAQRSVGHYPETSMHPLPLSARWRFVSALRCN